MRENSFTSTGHRIAPRLDNSPRSSQYEWRVVDLPRHLTRGDALALLTEKAEYGSWELARSVTFVGGARRVWLKRRRIRVVRTDAVLAQ